MSQKTLFTKSALAVAVALISTQAWSAGFQLNEFSSSGLGRAYSGEGAIADDAGNVREVAIKWSAAPDMTPQTVLYRRPVAQFSNFQPKIVSSWLILALFQANFLISGRSRLCPYQLVNSNQVRQGE